MGIDWEKLLGKRDLEKESYVVESHEKDLLLIPLVVVSFHDLHRPASQSLYEQWDMLITCSTFLRSVFPFSALMSSCTGWWMANCCWNEQMPSDATAHCTVPQLIFLSGVHMKIWIPDAEIIFFALATERRYCINNVTKCRTTIAGSQVYYKNNVLKGWLKCFKIWINVLIMFNFQSFRILNLQFC